MKLLRVVIALIVALPVSYVATIKALMVYMAWSQQPSSPAVVPALWFLWAGLFTALFFGLNRILQKYT